MLYDRHCHLFLKHFYHPKQKLQNHQAVTLRAPSPQSLVTSNRLSVPHTFACSRCFIDVELQDLSFSVWTSGSLLHYQCLIPLSAGTASHQMRFCVSIQLSTNVLTFGRQVPLLGTVFNSLGHAPSSRIGGSCSGSLLNLLMNYQNIRRGGSPFAIPTSNSKGIQLLHSLQILLLTRLFVLIIAVLVGVNSPSSLDSHFPNG